MGERWLFSVRAPKGKGGEKASMFLETGKGPISISVREGHGKEGTIPGRREGKTFFSIFLGGGFNLNPSGKKGVGMK